MRGSFATEVLHTAASTDGWPSQASTQESSDQNAAHIQQTEAEDTIWSNKAAVDPDVTLCKGTLSQKRRISTRTNDAGALPRKICSEIAKRC
jgi:hypothetical protein